MQRPHPEPKKSRTTGGTHPPGPNPGFNINTKPKGGGRTGPTGPVPNGKPHAG